MSALPQHKKSPEELAKLRESLGIPIAEEPPELLPSEDNPAPEESAPEPVTPAAAAALPPSGPRTHHSLKRSERLTPVPAEPVTVGAIPVLEAAGGVVTQLPVPTTPLAPAQPPKTVRSMKRSERMGGPISLPSPRPAPADGKLPGQRHSDEELAAIRRRSAVAAIAEGGYLPPQAASAPLLTVGYVLAIGGALMPTLLKLLAKLTASYNVGLAFSSGYHPLVVCAVAALPVAAFIYLKQTLSRHHAAFISIIAVFSLIFAILHYLPQLQYGT